jgi:hypothetical protein
MTQTYPLSAGTTSSDGADTVVAAQPAFHVEFFVSGAGTRSSVEPIVFSIPAAAVPEISEQITVTVYPLGVRAEDEEARQVTLSGYRSVGVVQREPTDEELLQGLRELMAEDERELGPIPEDARAEVERQWRD